MSKKSYKNTTLKERYRIGKKQKSWRSQIYIKLTRSNDDDNNLVENIPWNIYVWNVIIDEK